MHAAKGWALRVLTTGPVSYAFRSLMRQCGTIFMLHRFRDMALGVSDGHDPVLLRRTLEYLRRRRTEILPLRELFRRLEEERDSLAGAVAFTIDDGYLEQATIAGPVFAAYDCPVTTFVTTGFLDGHVWFWWDRIAFIFAHTERSWVRIAVPEGSWERRWSTPDERARVQAEFTDWCKTVPDDVKHAAIAGLAAEADVPVPGRPPRGYEPMSWNDLRTCERRGMSFGPHTVTHPVLSRTTDDASRYELEESWRRLRAEATNPVDIFCYPNGGWDDFSEREVSLLRQLGLQGAVVGVPGFARRRSGPNDLIHPYAVRRLPFPDDLAHTVQYISGLERLKMLLRRGDA